MEENLEKLLNLVKEICENNRQYKKGFNVITTFVKPHREVELHSRFITWLLDPNGPHGLKTLPLRLFLNQIGCAKFKINETSTKVIPNKSNWTEDREMDILIYNDVENENQKFAIIIENKIYAKDSDKGEENNGQLARYFYQIKHRVKSQKGEDVNGDYFYCSDKNIRLYYLTLDGHKPTNLKFKDVTLKTENQDDDYPLIIHLITYLDHIEPWLNEIILSIYNDERYLQTVEIIQQYLDALHCVSPNVKLNQELFATIEQNESLIETLKEFLQNKDKDDNDWIKLSSDQIEKELKENKIDDSLWATAIFLLKNHKHLYWHALAAFFDDLSKALEEELKPMGITKIEQPKNLAEELISNIIHQRGEKKKEHPYLGFWYNGVWWTIQLNEESKRFFVGVDKKNNKNRKDENAFNKDWLLLKDLKPIVNPWKFTEGQTFDLLSEQNRKNIAEQYAKFVKDELDKFDTK